MGGGRDDVLSATLAIRALHSLIEYVFPIPGSSALPFGIGFDKKMMIVLDTVKNSISNVSHNLMVQQQKMHRDERLIGRRAYKHLKLRSAC